MFGRLRLSALLGAALSTLLPLGGAPVVPFAGRPHRGAAPRLPRGVRDPFKPRGRLRRSDVERVAHDRARATRYGISPKHSGRWQADQAEAARRRQPLGLAA